MNPVKQIGRYKLPILNIIAIKKRSPYSFWKRGYDVLLNNGQKIHFTDQEKDEYDKALDEHELVLQVYGMCKGMGLR